MQSKTYRAKTMKEALTRVRRDLGGDAVILTAREVAQAPALWSGAECGRRGDGDRYHAAGGSGCEPARPGAGQAVAVIPAAAALSSPARIGEELEPAARDGRDTRADRGASTICSPTFPQRSCRRIRS